MKYIEVNPTSEIKGCINIQGSKNSALGLLAACCLADDIVTLNRIPNILDFRIICEIGRDIGMNITHSSRGEVVVDPTSINNAILDPVKTSSFRASYYFIGSLLHKFGEVSIGYPGGDDFGSRPIDQHVKGLGALGASFEFHKNHYVVRASELRGAEITFDVITSGATINVILAAALAKGRTVIRNAARDPEVVDVANLLNYMGANIRGAGTNEIIIDGVESLHGCTYSCIPDRLIAGSFMMAVGIVGGQLTIEDIIPEHLGATLSKLKEIGMDVEVKDHSVTVAKGESLRATRVRCAMYPGFATDLQQPLTSLLLQANGRSIISDRVYPNRFNHVKQLERMGAQIKVRGSAAFIEGGHPLHGAWVHASDVRAGTSLILAGLNAKGITRITGIEHIERGYEDVVSAFHAIGVTLSMRTENDSIHSPIIVSTN